MLLPRLLKTASFRLAAAYAVLFGASVALLAAVAYFAATSALDEQMRANIRVESHALEDEFRTGGFAAVLSAIRHRQDVHLAGGLEYTVFDSRGLRRAGALPKLSCTAGWREMTGPPDGDEPAGELEHLLVLTLPLQKGGCLFVADDVGPVRGLGIHILHAFAWVLALTLSLAIGGGIFLSSSILGRIEAINRTAQAIIDGDMKKRIPRRSVPDDLDRLAATLNSMLDRIALLMANLKQVSENIAHDLRTPLGKIQRLLESAQLSSLSADEYQNLTNEAANQTAAVLETFSAILRIAEIESGSQRLAFRPIDLSAIALEVSESFAPAAEEAGQIILPLIDRELKIDGDKHLMVQLLVNLVENAIRHSGTGTTITISLLAIGKTVELKVADTGCGIPLKERAKIFQRFYRLDRTRSAPGNGLGLSFVEAIASLHQATIVASDMAPGLAITVSFAPSLSQNSAVLA